MIWFLIGLILGCITGYLTNKKIYINITYKGEDEDEDDE